MTQLPLGLDRDSAMGSRLFDERDEAVKQMVQMAIAAAKKSGRKPSCVGTSQQSSGSERKF